MAFLPLRITLTLALLAGLTACGDDGPDGADNSVRMEVSGGIAGVNETVVLHEDGRLIAPDGTAAQAPPNQVAQVFALLRGGFFDLASQYLPADPCCDRFTYRVSAEVDGRRHSVTTMDATPGTPDQLMQLIDLLLSMAG
jgi:hypothetical protein